MSMLHEPLRAAKEVLSPRGPSGLTPDLKFILLASTPVLGGLMYHHHPFGAVGVLAGVLGLWAFSKWMTWL
jgi:hypothetical protein